MRLCERRCEACGELAGGPTSVFARVVWLCEKHSESFHAPAVVEVLRRASTTAELWQLIDAWLLTTSTLHLAESNLRLVPINWSTSTLLQKVAANEAAH